MWDARRLASIAFIVAALGAAIGYFVYAGLPSLSESGRSDTDERVIVCLKCQQETVLTAAKYADLDRDPNGYLVRCPKCGELAAVKASIRCGQCKRAIPPQPRDAAFVCPYCKASLAPGAQQQRGPQP